MTQHSFTKPNIGFAANPCNLQGLLQLNQMQFEMSLKLYVPLREWLTRCQGSENLSAISKRLSTKILLLYIARGTERSPMLTTPVLLTIIFPIHSCTPKNSGLSSGKSQEKDGFQGRKASLPSPMQKTEKYVEK